MSASTVRPVVVIAIDEIVVPEKRLRTLKEDQAEAIGQSIAAHGQFDPITVTRLPGHSTYLLVDGWHRLEGSKIVGRSTIEARVIGDKKTERVRHEAVSGMARATHDVFDRAAAIDALARLARAEEGLPEEGDLRAFNGPPTRALMAIDQAAEGDIRIIRKSLRWDVRLANALGCSDDTVRILRRVHLRIPEELKERLRHAGASDELAALNRLAGFSEREMVQVCAWLEAGDATTLTAAIAMLTASDVVPNSVEKAQNAFFRKAQAWTPRDRASFFHQWQSAYHPDGRPKAKG